MPTFDFITAKDFRESLEADTREMQRCAEAAAWKGVHVLAGSIVESLLIDYLVSTPNPSRGAKDPLKMDLHEAITVCRSEKVLSERTADLCSVVRSYRNLIHPGRMVRLEEPPPEQKSATVALALVDLISEELAKNRRAIAGLTGEQILSKIERDQNSLAILSHLLKETSEGQRERLLLDLIPAAYAEASAGNDPFVSDETAPRLKSSYRVILESAGKETRQRIAARFVDILRNGDGEEVAFYTDAFFRASDLVFVPENSRDMVVAHLLSRVPNVYGKSFLRAMKGISNYLSPADVQKWIDPLVRSLVSSTLTEQVKNEVRQHLYWEALGLEEEMDAAIDARLDDWISHLEKDSPENAELIREIKKEIADQRIPF